MKSTSDASRPVPPRSRPTRLLRPSSQASTTGLRTCARTARPHRCSGKRAQFHSLRCPPPPPQITAGGWVWVYNTAATFRHGLWKGADNKVLKEKLSLNWTGPFTMTAVGPSSAADTPDGRPLGDKLPYLDLPSNISGPAAKPRVTVHVASLAPTRTMLTTYLGISLPALRNMSYTPSRSSRLHTTSPRMTSPTFRS